MSQVMQYDLAERRFHRFETYHDISGGTACFSATHTAPVAIRDAKRSSFLSKRRKAEEADHPTPDTKVADVICVLQAFRTLPLCDFIPQLLALRTSFANCSVPVTELLLVDYISYISPLLYHVHLDVQVSVYPF
jgi:hypothetical protein